ncbi:helicase-associated domain-containing protein [Corynebacterium timonense]|uniref:Helicase conserved C-terminal domain-containing protein n=1 Tax=Corynebacterium timonense TaxID=441500 RepID=A0A1H1RFD1_9CORY|nr:helicase-associated domain-containing protein [Corynebacterium timonense]SDS34246.1 Helicase conserved C-terminal domain-containing protein [Corynebacterium timonense]
MDTLISSLAALSDHELRTLIRARPDATFPTPPSLAALASRLALPASLARAIRTLNAADIAVLETLADLGAELEPVDPAALAGQAEKGVDVDASVAKLRTRALVYGSEGLRVAPGALAGLPAGWRILDRAPADLQEKVEALDPDSRDVLDRLAHAGGIGMMRSLNPTVQALIDAGLLAQQGPTTVRLPRPVREALRGERPREYPLTPPPADPVDQEAVDREATAQGLDAVREMRQLVTLLLADPLPLNKDSTVGVRALATATAQLGFDPALAVTIGEAAGIIGRGDVDERPALAATREGLAWLEAPLAQQWAIVLAGWVASPWRIDLDFRLFDAPTRSHSLAAARETILEGPPSLLFRAPVAAAGMSETLIDSILREAHHVGAVAENHASTPMRALLTGGDVVEATRALVPAEVTEVIAQADMTLLIPGPPTPETARAVEAFADLESPGLASVYRVSEASLRRALSAGWGARELHEWLTAHCIGQVPQALSFLIDDVARTHGALRAGQALSYVRSEDPALLARAAGTAASLRMLAPTVAVSALSLTALLSELRAAGLHPSAEDASGAVLNMPPEPELVRATPSRLPRVPAPRDTEEVLRALRAGGDAGDAPTTSTADAIDVIRAAARARRRISLRFVDSAGTARSLTVVPLRVAAGQVDAQDVAKRRIVRVPLSRVTAAEAL